MSGDRTFEDSISISVTEPRIKIVPEIGTYEVNFRTQFLARTDSWPSLPAGSVVWSASPRGIVDIDQDGNAVMLKPGEAEIVVIETGKSPVRATAKIKVIDRR